MLKKDLHDVVIIGGGIASLTAALYTARANMKPVILCGKGLDQLSLTTTVENYPGFPQGILGPDLIKNCREQAKKFGAFCIEEEVDSFKIEKGFFEVGAGKKKYNARSVIIATGASARKLGIPGEDKYFGKGVSTCAICDAALYRDKVAVVVGGGDSAMEESLALYKFAKKIYLTHRRDSFRASKIMQNRVLKLKDKIEIIYNTGVTEVIGDGKFVTGVRIKNLVNGKEDVIKCDGMFLAIGHIPNTIIFKGKIKLDEEGYIITDDRRGTSVIGIFAAGDVQDRIFKQAVTSAGTGCQAAIGAERFIEDLKARGEY